MVSLKKATIASRRYLYPATGDIEPFRLETIKLKAPEVDLTPKVALTKGSPSV